MVKAISMTGVLVVKMKDVAELAGVSSAAVSRYLNGGYISADKAERIKHAIELTGYVRSSQLARCAPVPPSSLASSYLRSTPNP